MSAARLLHRVSGVPSRIKTRSVATQMVEGEVLASARGVVGTITLNRPKALNALNLNMVRKMYPLLQEWNCAGDIQLILIKGAGEKAFCAGGDVLAVSASALKERAGEETTLHKDFFKEEYRLNFLLGKMSTPYVALMDGIVMGGGCGLSINGRYRVATEKTMLAMPETALGLFPDVGGSYFLSRLSDNLGMFLALTGHRLTGADVFHSGLASHYIRSEDLPKLEEEFAGLKKIDDALVRDVLASYSAAEVPEFGLKKDLEKIRRCFAGRSVVDIIKRLKDDDSEWAKKQHAVIGKMSPTSLKVTAQQLDMGSRMSFAEIFPMEYRLSQRLMEEHDFHEGCRAILIDKDRKPKWKPATLEEVDDHTVDSYFRRLPTHRELELHDHYVNY
ncbi:unnamed protein product, partial [Mesorhabditis spiculigera]